MIRSEPLRVERYQIAIAQLPSSLSGVKLVQLSDFHYDGVRLSETLLTEVIERSNQENPDLVFLTGDFVTNLPNPIHNLSLRLKHLRAKSGIYACLGNHDLVHPHSQTEITKALERIGVKVLWNEVVYPLGQKLAIAGLIDFWSEQWHPEAVFKQISPEIPRIVLSHNPDTAEILQQWRIDLQLSGHTHGGQVTIPGYGSLPMLIDHTGRKMPKLVRPLIPMYRRCSHVVNHWEWSRGWHQVGNNKMYVNRGLGAYFPGRWGCPPELTVITLVC